LTDKIPSEENFNQQYKFVRQCEKMWGQVRLPERATFKKNELIPLLESQNFKRHREICRASKKQRNW
jgi:hypothetical protein